jgi:hypothetical protein
VQALQGCTLRHFFPTGKLTVCRSPQRCRAIRRWRRHTEVDFGQPTAATTRWRVTTLPSTPLPVPGVGRARWRVELIRCRAG